MGKSPWLCRLRAVCTSLAASHPGVLHNWTDHLQLDVGLFEVGSLCDSIQNDVYLHTNYIRLYL